MRAFIAVEIPQTVREAVVAVQSVLHSDKVRVSWVNVDNIHLTIKFLGEVPEEQLPDIHKGLNDAAAQLSPFTITITGAGAFPSIALPRVLWVGCLAPVGEKLFVPSAATTTHDTSPQIERHSQLEQLAATVEREMERHGFAPEERPFTGHLTIGRIKFPKPDPALTSALESLRNKTFGTAPVKEIVLFKSDLRPEGPIYTKISSHPLRQPAAL